VEYIFSLNGANKNTFLNSSHAYRVTNDYTEFINGYTEYIKGYTKFIKVYTNAINVNRDTLIFI